MTTTDAAATSSKPAPGDLVVVQDFINTRELQGEDALSDAGALERWLLGRRLLKAKGKATEPDLRHALEVREALRDLVAANDGLRVGNHAVDALGRAARSAQLGVHFRPDGRADLAPAASGVDAALGEMLAIAFRSMIDGSWGRLKICRDDTCRWAYYDRSKNRSGSWCSMSVCGNRNKARRFRGQKPRNA